MTHASTLAFSLATLAALTTAATDARADIVSDRVLLQTGLRWGCAGSNEIGYYRVRQMPDGTSASDGTEWQVPEGMYLEITSIEYTTPSYVPWAFGTVQTMDLLIRPRSSGGNAIVFTAKFQNQVVYASNGTSLEETNEYVGPGAQTRVAAFPYGPLMSSAGRLCVAAHRSVWLLGAGMRVRGRLIPTGLPANSTAPTGTW